MKNYLKERAKGHLLNAYDFKKINRIEQAKRYYARYEEVSEIMYECYDISIEKEYQEIINELEEL